MRAALRAMLAIVLKDLDVWRRRPVSIVLTLGPPLVFLAVIAISAGAVGRNPVALVVLDDGPHAAQLATTIGDSDAFRVSRTDATTASRMLRDLDVAAVVTIPAGFEQRYLAHESDPVTIRINNLNLDFTNDLRRSLPAAITSFYAGQPGSASAVRMQETDLRVRDVSLLQFELVPDLVLLLVVAGTVNGGIGTASEFELRTMTELLLAPISRALLIAGKLLAGWMTALLVGAVVVLVGAAAGILRPTGWYWATTLLVVALMALASAGIGTAIGARLRALVRVAPITINLAIWLFFLSGGIGVAAFLPDWARTLAAFTPTYYGVHALQMSIFYSSTDGLPRDLLVLGLTAVAGLALGTLSLRRGLVA